MSNIAITPGTGVSSVATETISGIDYQKVKIIDGTPSSTTPLAVNANGSIGVSILGAVPVTGSFSTTAAFTQPSSFVSRVTSVITSTSQTSVLTTAPASQRNYVTQMLVTNGAAVGTFVDIMDGPNVVYSGYAAASGGGFSASFPTAFQQSTLTQSLDIKARVQASIIAAISGYTAA